MNPASWKTKNRWNLTVKLSMSIFRRGFFAQVLSTEGLSIGVSNMCLQITVNFLDVR